MAVVPDDDDSGQRISDEEERQPSRAQTPPTPPVQHEPSRSPLPSPRPMRQRAFAQLRLPDKFARFLFEFHAHRFEILDLPFLPADRSDFDVHRALLDDKVHEYVIL